MDLAVTVTEGDAALPPVVLAHGLFGTGRNLGGLARRLAQAGRRVLQPDMRNHGDSFWDDDHAYPSLADDLARLIAGHGGVADVVGHSMGGKAAMTLAQRSPQAVRRLVVLDIAPLAYGHSQRPLIAQMRAARIAGVTRRAQADAALAEAGVDDPSVRAFLLQSLRIGPEGARWRMNLDALDAQMERLTGWPDDLPRAAFAGPVLALAGGESDYVGARGAAAFAEWLPQAEVETVEGSGHWLHADAAEAVGARVERFLA